MNTPTIFNFITNNRTLIKLLTITIFVVYILLLIFFQAYIFSTSNMYFYLYSTIAQTFIALIAFLGALAVFKIQQIDNTLNKLPADIEMMEDLNNQKTELRRKIVDFTIIVLTTVGTSLLLLPFSEYLSWHPLVGVATAIVSLSLSLFSLYCGFMLVREILGYNFNITLKDKINIK